MPLLEVKNIKKYYPVGTGRLFGGKKFLKAVDGVSFTLEKGETLGLVGESGCGKSTLGRALIRLETPTSGEIILNGINLSALHGEKLRRMRGSFQMIFQDPYGSLNPRMTIFSALDEALSLHTKLSGKERLEQVGRLLEMVGLRADYANRHPHQFSGGQRQRIGIARALAVNPSLIVADEPVSALDVSVQAQIVNLLQDLQKKREFAMLFIAHDLAVVEHISSRIMVMYLGKAVEIAPSHELCSNPKHPYTRALLASAPSMVPGKEKTGLLLSGDIPSPLAPPAGCRFHPRCPFAKPVCSEEEPCLKESSSGSFCACHFPGVFS